MPAKKKAKKNKVTGPERRAMKKRAVKPVERRVVGISPVIDPYALPPQEATGESDGEPAGS